MKFFLGSVSAGLFIPVLPGCNDRNDSAQKTKEHPCSDLSGLNENDLKARKNLGYQEKAVLKDKRCATCSLFLPAKTAQDCSKCSLFKGPVNPEGTCTYWSAKNEELS